MESEMVISSATRAELPVVGRPLDQLLAPPEIVTYRTAHVVWNVL